MRHDCKQIDLSCDWFQALRAASTISKLQNENLVYVAVIRTQSDRNDFKIYCVQYTVGLEDRTE